MITTSEELESEELTALLTLEELATLLTTDDEASLLELSELASPEDTELDEVPTVRNDQM